MPSGHSLWEIGHISLACIFAIVWSSSIVISSPTVVAFLHLEYTTKVMANCIKLQVQYLHFHEYPHKATYNSKTHFFEKEGLSRDFHDYHRLHLLVKPCCSSHPNTLTTYEVQDSSSVPVAVNAHPHIPRAVSPKMYDAMPIC